MNHLTDSFLWTRHVVECRRGCRHSKPSLRCRLGLVLYAKAAAENDRPRIVDGYMAAVRKDA